MKKASIAVAFVVSLGLTAACGRSGDDGSGGSTMSGSLFIPVSVTGCVTASEDRILLTALAPGRSQLDRRQGRPYPTTEVYELAGENQKLRGYVGWQVRVHGEAPPLAVAILREHSPAAPASPVAIGTSGQSRPRAEGNQVRTQQQIRLEMTKLRVRSVTPIRARCTGRTD